MMLDECVKGRRSVRSYSDEPVSRELIEAVLEAGVWAPSGMNRQPWRFIVIEDKELIGEISEETKKIVPEVMPQMAGAMKSKEDVICYDAPVLILVCAEKDEMLGELNKTDCVLAAQNMFLKAYDLGLGSCYMGFIDFLKGKSDVLDKAGLPDDHELMVALILGHPREKQGAGERKPPSILKWVK